MVFNVLAQNLDDHVKNISFLMAEDGTWRLSPAYDLVWCSLQHPTFARGHQMTVAGRALEITGTLMKDLAKQYSITKPNEVIEEVIEALSGFEDLAKKYGVKELFTDKYNQVSQALVESRKLASR
jgi:serine/threonine-protein kinase HipA